MKKHLLIATAFATLVAGSASSSNPAQASWAESAQGNPVYTGTDQSLWRSERAIRRHSHGAQRRYGWRRGYYEDPGYSAYGAYNGGVYGSDYGGGYFR